MNMLEGKIALVTGGGEGIGEAVARCFAQAGAAVGITGRRKEVIETVVADIIGKGGKALAISGSVTDEAHAREAVASMVKTFGGIHILVNNAGIGGFGTPIHEMNDDTWNEIIDINLTGVFRVTRAVIPEMLKAGGGSIVNISSIAAHVGIPLLPAYAASKGGLNALTRSLAIDYAKDGIRCNAVSPGLVDTPMAESLIKDPERLAQVMSAYPLRRPGTTEEVAKLVRFLASDDSAWITGAIYPIDGGMTAQ